MKVMITGLSGFTGQYVKDELLQHGHDVVGLSSDLTDQAGLNAEIKTVQPDAIIHLAAIAFVAHGSANDFYETNLIGTRNLLEAIAIHHPKISSILLASSANIYGNQTEGILSEQSPPAPVNDYAVSKLAMENMAKLWQSKLPLFIVRPFNYTGLNQNENFVIPKIVKHFKQKSDTIELGNLDVWREYNNVKSIAQVYRQLIKINPVGQTINICSGDTHSLKEILSYCQTITGHKIKVTINPKFVRNNELKHLAGDDALLQSLIGSYQFTDIKDTLAWMLEGRHQEAGSE